MRHDGMRDHRHSQQLQAMNRSLAERVIQRRQDGRERIHEERRRQRECDEGRKGAHPARADHAQRKAELAARGPGKQLAQRQQMRETRVVDPAAAFDQLAPEIAEMRDRPAERGDAEFQKRPPHLADATIPAVRVLEEKRSRPPVYTPPIKGATAYVVNRRPERSARSADRIRAISRSSDVWL